VAKWMAGVLQIAGVPVAPAEILRTASAWVHGPMWDPRSIAKLVQITPITMVYGAYNL